MLRLVCRSHEVLDHRPIIGSKLKLILMFRTAHTSPGLHTATAQ